MTIRSILLCAVVGIAALGALPAPAVAGGRVAIGIGFAPPPPRYERVVVRPGYVWTPGYWRWSGRRYVWVGGYYLRARPGHYYVGPAGIRTALRIGRRAGGSTWATGCGADAAAVEEAVEADVVGAGDGCREPARVFRGALGRSPAPPQRLIHHIAARVNQVIFGISSLRISSRAPFGARMTLCLDCGSTSR